MLSHSRNRFLPGVGLLLLLSCALLPNPAMAQAFSFGRPQLGLTLRGGILMPRASGPLFNLMRSNLTFAAADLQSTILGAEVSAQVAGHVQLFGGFETGSVTTASQAQAPAGSLSQATRFELGPNVYAGVRFSAFPRGGSETVRPHRFNPFISVGAGRKTFELEQEGDFPDQFFGPSFSAHFVSEGTTGYGFVSMGGEFALPAAFFLSAEVRYQGGEGTPDRDYARFESIDLSGVSLSIGFTRYW